MKKVILILNLLWVTAFGVAQESDSTHQVLIVAEQMPSFVGGEKALSKYIASNINYPQKELEAKIEGTVYVTFIVQKDGKVSDVEIMSSVENGKNLDKEAIRIMNEMPLWTPGMQEEVPVAVRFNLSIPFNIKKYLKRK